MVQRRQLLLTGGRKGWVTILELPHRHQRQSFLAHDSPVKALAVDPTEDCFISGSAEGNIKTADWAPFTKPRPRTTDPFVPPSYLLEVWSLATHCLLYTFPNEHARQSLFRNLGTGVMQIEVGPASHIFSCGADGTMKMRTLPNRFAVAENNSSSPKSDVKFFI
ncbi:hypothetical protein GOODEAATRI_002588 [Goodea atripinnis]|uniref:Uncharacterized protein n=1 Tax=Goodea atripinnis TaxID=208336 RepID=A0ABV0P103_9TELE